MAFPVVASTAESPVTSAGTSHAITLPGTIRDQDLLIIVFGKAQAVTLNALSGWTELVDTNSANAETILYHYCDGTETSPATFTSSGSTKSASVCYRITGAENPTTQVPELSTVATATSVNPNATTCTPTGGAKDYLWLTFFISAGEEADDDTWVSATPTSYTNTLQTTSGTAGVASTNCSTASAEQQLNASSQDAAAWTMAQSLAWRAWTLAIHPSSRKSMPGARKDSVPDLRLRDNDPWALTGWRQQ